MNLRKISTLIALLALVLTLLAGCGEDSDNGTNPTNNGTGDATITATIDGTAIDYSANAAGVIGAGMVVIGGGDSISGDGTLISLPHTTGIHVLVGGSDTAIVLTLNFVSWASTSGTVTITTATSDRLVATFSGTFTNSQQATVSVTNGIINVPL